MKISNIKNITHLIIFKRIAFITTILLKIKIIAIIKEKIIIYIKIIKKEIIIINDIMENKKQININSQLIFIY